MKFKVSMKCPDALTDAITEAVTREVTALELDEEETQVLVDNRVAKVEELCKRWFEYSEYLTVEIDTDAKTCTVVG